MRQRTIVKYHSAIANPELDARAAVRARKAAAARFAKLGKKPVDSPISNPIRTDIRMGLGGRRRRSLNPPIPKLSVDEADTSLESRLKHWSVGAALTILLITLGAIGVLQLGW